MTTPDPLHQVLYLGSFQQVPPWYREWLEDILTFRRPRRTGWLLALPFVASFLFFGGLLAAIGDLNGLAMFGGGGVFIAALFVGFPPSAYRRARGLARKNELESRV